MQKNFSLGSAGAEVVINELPIDLHNLYNVAGIKTDDKGDAIILAFDRDPRSPGREGLPDRVTLTCSGALKLAFNDLTDAPVPLREDAVEVFYYNPDCDWDEVLDESLANAHGFVGLHISFSGGLALRIQCARAEVTTG